MLTGGFSIHNLGLVGHIEDIAVTKDQQGKKLGLRIIEALDYVAKKVGCYKVGSFTVHSFGGAIAGQALFWQTYKAFGTTRDQSTHAMDQRVHCTPSIPSHSLLYPGPTSPPLAPAAIHSHPPLTPTRS